MIRNQRHGLSFGPSFFHRRRRIRSTKHEPAIAGVVEQTFSLYHWRWDTETGKNEKVLQLDLLKN